MDIKEIVKKIADLLHNGSVKTGKVWFDFDSYDMEEDIPYLLNDKGKIIRIEWFFVNKDGSEIIVTTEHCDEYTLNMSNFTENDLEAIGMYELLSNVYYETNDSYEIGDFEIDFLKI